MVYFSDDGDVLGMRFDNWKIVFMEQRVPGTLQALGGAVHPAPRIPKLFNLRTDPFERADITSNTYYDWIIENAYIVGAAQPLMAEFLADVHGVPATPEGGVLHHRPGAREDATTASSNGRAS